VGRIRNKKNTTPHGNPIDLTEMPREAEALQAALCRASRSEQ